MNQFYRYALSLSRDRDVAYDLVQSSLERGLKKDLKQLGEPVAYIKTIIRNLFYDMERRNKVIPFLSLDSDDTGNIEEIDEVTLEDVYIRQEDVERLVNNLSAEENELIFLWAVEEYTVDEIAKLQEKPRGTILSKLYRLKKKIRSNDSIDIDVTHNRVKS